VAENKAISPVNLLSLAHTYPETLISMKREIERFVIGEAKKLASRKIAEIAKDPIGFFTPHHIKITVLASLRENGAWGVSKGRSLITTSLVARVDQLCKDAGVADGWIAYEKENGRAWIDFSPFIPEPTQQRISNAIHAH
jgi:hypothetical protein